MPSALPADAEALKYLLEWQRVILESASCAIIATDLQGIILTFNPAAERILGYRAEELVGKHSPAKIHDPEEVLARASILSAELGEEVQPGFDVFVAKTRRQLVDESEWTYICKNGSRCPVKLSVTALRSSDGSIQGYLGIARDLTREKALEAEANAAREQLLRQVAQKEKLSDTVFEYSAEAIMVTDGAGRILNVNPAFNWLTGYRPDEVIGQTPALLKSGRHDAAFYQAMWTSLLEKGHWEGEVWDKHKDGHHFPKWSTINAVRNGGGEITHFIALFSDISERKENETRIQFLAEHDHLTGLPNRRLLEQRAAALIHSERHGEQELALILIDLDRFKNVNDTLGHQAGDQLLIEVARRLSACVRTTDLVVRLGGDEFVVLLSNMAEGDDLCNVARKIHAALGAPFVVSGQTVHTPPSMGISRHPQDGADVETLLRHADTAMYQVKANGRNAWAFYDQEMDAKLQSRLQLEAELHEALDAGAFELHFQPQFDLVANKITGWETLLRWPHPTRGWVPPQEIIPMAEETGLILPLGRWILSQACQEAARWQQEGIGEFSISVNISPRQVEAPGFAAEVAQILAETKLAPRHLELEITEALLMRPTPQVQETLQALKILGISLALDDFGTGYSALGYLKTYAIDRLKIDRSFIARLLDDAEETAIVKAVLSMADALQLDVVAEGVENEQQQAMLIEQGCRHTQGFLRGHPMPGHAVHAFLQTA